MRAYGDTKRPMIFLAIGGVANVILNLITVVGFDMSVRGVAIATAASHFIAAFLTVITLIKTSQPIKLILKGIKLNKVWSKQIVSLGIPAGIQTSLFSLSNVVIQSAINSLEDPHIIAGNGNAANVEGFLYLAIHAFYQTTNDQTVTVFDNTNEAAADHLTVIFNQAPVYDLQVASGSLTINQSGVNYAVVSGMGVLTAKKYTHTQQIVKQSNRVSGD
jgi:hypothetical protein